MKINKILFFCLTIFVFSCKSTLMNNYQKGKEDYEYLKTKGDIYIYFYKGKLQTIVIQPNMEKRYYINCDTILILERK